MAVVPTYRFVVTGRSVRFSRDEVETYIKSAGGAIQQLVNDQTHFFFDFAGKGKGKKYDSWRKAVTDGLNIRSFGETAFDEFTQDPSAFFAKYAPAAASARPTPAPTVKYEPAAYIPKRKAMFKIRL